MTQSCTHSAFAFLAFDFQKIGLLLSLRGAAKTDFLVLLAGRICLDSLLPASNLANLGAPSLIRSSSRSGLAPTTFDFALPELFTSVKGFGGLDFLLPVPAGSRSGSTPSPSDCGYLDLLLTLHSLGRLGFAPLLSDFAHPEFAPSLHSIVCPGFALSLIFSARPGSFILALDYQHSEASLLLRGLGRIEVFLFVLYSAQMDSFLPLQSSAKAAAFISVFGISQAGPLLFALDSSCLGFALLLRASSYLGNLFFALDFANLDVVLLLRNLF